MNHDKKSITAIPDAGNITIAKIFSDNMVLQRDTEIPVWGWGKPGGTVQVRLGGQSCQTIIDGTGKWLVKLSPMIAGGPYEMTVAGKKSRVLGNVMIGDVWLCSGQSNVEWPLKQSKDAAKEITAADYPGIRLFTCPPSSSQTPQSDLPENTGSWRMCTPENAADFSAVGYFFGRDIFRNLNIPVGLICSSVGGTGIELWMSRDSLRLEPEAKSTIEKFEEACSSLCLQEKLDEFNGVRARVSSCLDHARRYVPQDWVFPEFDDREWKPVKRYGEEAAAHALMNLRTIVEIPEEWEAGDLSIYIYYPMVYGRAVVFFNGHPARQDDEWIDHHFKKYFVDGKYVKAGKTVIAEHSFSYQYENETSEGRAKSYIAKEGSDRKILLDGAWKENVLDKFPPGTEPMHPRHMKALNGLYNAMINPLIPFAIRGIVWYQGESNVQTACKYGKLLPLMIRSWRAQWGQENIPFLIVQLANYGEAVFTPGSSLRAELREFQMITASSVPNCGLVVTVDIGESDNLHPVNKQDVGFRLALVARRIVYGQAVVHSGPVLKSIKREGNRLVLSFENIGGGLIARGGRLKHFALAGTDNRFVWADAVIAENKVAVSSGEIAEPVAVRYAWADNPDGCNLYNREGLPAVPFRTDEWKNGERVQPKS